MTIYKAILKILKMNKSNLLIGLLVMGVITIFYASQLVTDAEELSGEKIAILSKDDSAVAKDLINYLDEQHTIVSLKDTSQKGLDDALYFNEVKYIVTIPEDFSATLTSGKRSEIIGQTRPDTFSKSLVDTTINNYLNTYLIYQKELPTLSQAALLTETRKTLAKEGTVRFDATYQKKKKQTVSGQIYNLLAYGLFFSIFSGYAAVNLAFNRTKIKERNNCAPVSRRKFASKIAKANLLYTFFCWFLFVAFILLITWGNTLQVTGYFLLNTLIFLGPIISFSVMTTSVIQNEEAINGIKNVFIMGSCFIGGIFVPSEFLPEIVDKIAAFTPTYWFVQTNQLIGNTVSFNYAFTKEFLLNSGILLLFSLLFLIIHQIAMRQSWKRGGEERSK